MDELMRSLEGAREDQTRMVEEIPKEVHGVLAAHIKTVELVSNDDADANSSMINMMQLQLEVQGQSKVMRLSSCLDQSCSGVCDQLKHFMIELLPSDHSKSHDLVKMELVIPSPLLLGSVTVLARGTLPLGDIIHGSPLSGRCGLTDVESGHVFASISADWVFCYGTFGFGESYQLKHSSHRPGDYLHCSLFPRLPPPEQHADSSGLILNPQTTAHPAFIPFKKHAQLCVKESSEDIKESVPTTLVQSMARLRLMQRQLRGKKSRRERLRFLEEAMLSGASTQHGPSVGVTARGGSATAHARN